MTNKTSDINVVLLPDIEEEFDSLRDACLDILKTCKTNNDLVALIDTALQGARETTLREVATKKIQMLAQALQETER
jgi:hypothetical protein